MVFATQQKIIKGEITLLAHKIFNNVYSTIHIHIPMDHVVNELLSAEFTYSTSLL